MLSSGKKRDFDPGPLFLRAIDASEWYDLVWNIKELGCNAIDSLAFTCAWYGGDWFFMPLSHKKLYVGNLSHALAQAFGEVVPKVAIE